jgi:hypothetical protein
VAARGCTMLCAAAPLRVTRSAAAVAVAMSAAAWMVGAGGCRLCVMTVAYLKPPSL